MKIPRIFLAGLIAGGLIAGSNPCKGETTAGGGCYQGLSSTTLTSGSYTFTSLGGPDFAHTYQINSGTKTLDYNNCTVTTVLDLQTGPIVTNVSELYGDGGVGGGDCCPVAPLIWGTAPFGNVSVTLTNINAATFSMTLATNVHHITIFDLGTGTAVYNSGALGTSSMVTVSNAVLIPGRSYAVTACDSNNLIQGSVCIQAGATGVTALRQFKSWQNGVTNMPGAEIDALVGPNQMAVLVQYSDASMALGTGSLNSSPPAASLAYQGLTNTPAGNAVMSLLGSSLYVSNLSSSGQDGVSISLPAGVSAFDVGMQPLDSSNALPVGAYLQERSLGTVNGVGNSVLGTATMTKGSSNCIISADFSAIGATTYTVQAYLNGHLVGQQSGPNGGGFCYIPAITNHLDNEGVGCPGGCPASVEGPQLTVNGKDPFNLAFFDGTVVYCNKLSITPENPTATNVTAATSFQIFASQISGFTITSENATQTYEGLANTSLGNATVTVSGSTLYITNLSSGGQDGVSFTMPPAPSGLDVEWQDLDAGNTLPVGAYVKSRAVDAGGNVMGVLTETKLGPTNYQLAVDFSGLAATTYNATAYLHGMVVGQVTNQPASIYIRNNHFTQSQDAALGGASIGPFWIYYMSMDWNAFPALMSFNSTQFFLADKLEITPGDVTWSNAPSAVELTASQVPGFTITSENASQAYHGLVNSSLGNATFSVANDTLYVSNLSSGGQDGVSISLPTNSTGIVVGLQDPDASGTEPVGAYVQSQAVGSVNGSTSGVLGTLTVTKLGTTNYSLAADYSAVGASTFNVQVYSHGVLVGQSSGQSGGGGFAYIPKNPPQLDLEWPGWGGPWPYYPAWDEGPQFTVGLINTTPFFFTATSTVLYGDHLVLTPSSSTLLTPPTAFQVVASGVQALTFTNENVSEVYQDLTNSSLGNASLDVTGSTLYVSNLSSGGQDGLAFSLPTNLSSLELDWQRLDVSNALPVGAYLQSEAVGTANGITNGVLGTLTVAKAGTTNYSVSADFSRMGASTYTLQAYLNGALVGQVTNLSGASMCYMPIYPIGFDFTWAVYVDGFYVYSFSTHSPFPFLLTISGHLSAMCDELVVTPENVTFPSAPTAYQITGSQIPAMTATAVTVSPLRVDFLPNGKTLRLHWYGSGTLQQSSDLSHWSNVSDAASPYNVSIGAGNQFFRINQPSP